MMYKNLFLFALLPASLFSLAIATMHSQRSISPLQYSRWKAAQQANNLPANAPLALAVGTTRAVASGILTAQPDTTPTPKPRKGTAAEEEGNFLTRPPQTNPIDLKLPPSIQQDVSYDPTSNRYVLTQRVGDGFYSAPTYMTFEEYLKWQAEKQKRDYFKQLAKNVTAVNEGKSVTDPLRNIDVKSQLVNMLFGEGGVDIRPQGSIDITLGGNHQRIANPNFTRLQQNQGAFNFDMGIQLNVVGTIGSKLKLTANYNTKSTFDFDNQVKIQYGGVDLANPSAAINGAIPQSVGKSGGTEDQILQDIQAGTISFPLRSTLIQGTQTLFGLKTKLKFGHLFVTNVISQQKSKRQEIQIQGGTQLQTFAIEADRYDENRHFFTTHYNRNRYEGALKNLPQINSLFRITKLDLWVTNTRNATEGGVRDIVALADLGESRKKDLVDSVNVRINVTNKKDLAGNPLPYNDANNLYYQVKNPSTGRAIDAAVNRMQQIGLVQTRDFEKVRARKLALSEYTFNPDLGYLSLNTTLQPTDVLGVSMEYTYNGKVFQVGEFAQDIAVNSDSLNVIFVKMLKATTANVNIPLWNLMMKNVYSLNAYQINPQDFKLDVFYQDPGGGERRFIPAGNINGEPLIRVLNLDNLNAQRDPIPDGVFDFVPGITITPQNGRVIFPVLEPFGSSLRAKFDDTTIARKYIYPQLYNNTLFRAREFPEFNRFILRGSYKSSSSSDISLGAFNIPRGSVKVNAGGQVLREGIDYDIDYNIGRVKIINEAIMNSGLPIRVSFEDNATFGFNIRNMIGTRLDYNINPNFSIGATHMRLDERSFTRKVNIGDDPIDNNILGLDVNYTKEAPWLTKALDKLPFYSTKAPSKITFNGEVAHLIPGHSNSIANGADKGGTIYLDDFEGSVSNIDLRNTVNNWQICGTPRPDPIFTFLPNHPRFIEGDSTNSLISGVNRAKINWYRIDQTIYDASNPYTAPILETDIFRNAQFASGQNINTFPFEVTYYPTERGVYNFETSGEPGISSGVTPTGKLKDPKTRWGGIQRAIQNSDFEASNIEFVEMWVMSPFHAGNTTGGDLYLNLGNTSEDVLRDSRMFFENGLPRPGSTAQVDVTRWGRIPRSQPITNAFDNDPASRNVQDVGLDGLDDEQERAKFASFLTQSQAILTSDEFNKVQADPSNDNFKFYNNESYTGGGVSVLTRYSRNNNPQGNSQSNANQAVVTSSTNIPDTEDLNHDNTLNETEAYFEYKIALRPLPGSTTGEIAPNPYITDTVVSKGIIYYQLKIPIDQFTNKIGQIQDFRSIRFVRMYMTDWEQQATLRFARLQLVRNQWRRYRRPLLDPFVGTLPPDNDPTVFDVTPVNLEQNGSRTPVNYVIPSGISRELSTQVSSQQTQQNEQSLQLQICNLYTGDSRAIFKTFNLDMRAFKRLKMFVHAEPRDPDVTLKDKDLHVFMRIGSDFENNYYEYDIPLKLSIQNTSQLLEGKNIEDKVWLDGNSFDFPLALLRQAKTERNTKNLPNNLLYSFNDPDKTENRVSVKGNPDLGYAKGVMIGVRNPVSSDGGLAHCITVWVNELRTTGIDERGGTAALARLDVQLADLGNVTLSGNYHSIGWGNLDQKVQQRAREELIQYDAASNIELGKFLPKKSGIRLPFYAQYSNEVKIPQFDPYQLDIPFQELMSAETDKFRRDSLRSQAITQTQIRGFNFTNVRKDRTGKSAPMPWDIENFSATYAYNQTFKSDPTIQSNVLEQYRGALDYTYARADAKFIQPFSFIKNDLKGWLALIKDFNFNPLPNSFTFSNQLNRQFGEIKYRFSGEGDRATWFDKRFTWDRSYQMTWNLTKSIGINLSAVNNAWIDEPRGRINTQEKQDTLLRNIQKFGRTRNYQHTFGVNYTLPFGKIPLLDFVQVKAQYNATYNWSTASLNTDSLGNVIQNTQNRQLNADLDFVKLYNKWSYLRKINSPMKPREKKKKGKDDEIGDKGKEGKEGAPAPKKENDVVLKDKNGKVIKDPKKKKEREPTVAERLMLRPLMMVRKGRATYQEQFGTVVPGFTQRSKVLGMSQDFQAPGWDFVAGWQPASQWLDDAAAKGWITSNVYLNQQVQQTYTQTINAQLSVEPFDDFRVDFTANRTYSKNHTEYFKVDTVGGSFRHLTPMDMGSFSVSFFSLNTMFTDPQGQDFSRLFADYQDNRSTVARRLGQGVHSGRQQGLRDSLLGFPEGFGRYQQEVLIPSFIAAYTKTDAAKIDLNMFNTLPMPNWKLTYNGLTKLKPFSKWFTSFNLTHGYQNKMTINSYRTNLRGIDEINPLVRRKDSISQSFYSEFEIPDIVISEQLSPLIGIDVRFKNDITARFDFKKARTLTMNFNDYQMNETRTEEIVFGGGYRVKGFKIPFLDKDFKKKQYEKKKAKRVKNPKDDKDKKPDIGLSAGGGSVGNDLNIKLDFSLRDDITYNRPLDQDPVRTRGLRTIRLSPSVDYQVTKNLNLRLFYDYTNTTPATSASFPITTQQGGLIIRFTLGR